MNVKKVLEKIDFYLDINHEDEIANIIQEVQQREIPIFAFETTSHDLSGYSHVYSPAAVDQMIESIRTLLESQKQSL
ncbi:putative CDP-glycerol:glycerophosphate glycerophosphotransferase [Streptococcus oralis]|uniref:Putative CDP-glycerol:glycerophosphate glycerophosphotransferase n=1 Tax=Streptococcus oralis TaxID=1303 RepID=A0A139QQY1_STROR|nr:putative CDP-glycerol:glycerophosphate glycerophosphotransferase [Streptococcus oralis]